MNTSAIGILAALGVLFVLPLRAEEPVRQISPVEQNVIEALLTQSMLKGYKQRILINETATFLAPFQRQHLDEWRRCWPDEPKYKEALDDYLLKNDTAATMVFSRPFRHDIKVLSVKELKEIDKNSPLGNEFTLFFKKFPESDGPIWISRPAFDSQRMTAIIAMAGFDSGRFYYLEKKGKDWILTDQVFGPSWEF